MIKKNWTMRAAVLMFALVLISSCFVGGTFAKYVTVDDGSGTARVAKFGVAVSVDSDTMFDTKYAIKDAAEDVNGNDIEYSVVSANGTDKLVAPGTSEDGTLKFSVKGAPEVAVKVELALTINNDVFLAKNNDGEEYRDYTTADTNAKFTLTEDYTPVVFTLKQGDTVVASGTLDDIDTALSDISGNYAPNTDLTTELGDYTLSWAWAFDVNDKADTLLGNLAADTATGVDPGAYSTEIDFALTATVTQID